MHCHALSNTFIHFRYYYATIVESRNFLLLQMAGHGDTVSSVQSSTRLALSLVWPSVGWHIRPYVRIKGLATGEGATSALGRTSTVS